MALAALVGCQPAGLVSGTPLASPDVSFLDSIEWIRLDADELPALSSLHAVDATDEGIIAFDRDGFWFSADGQAWEAVGPKEPETIWRDLLPLDGGSFLAVGYSIAEPLSPRLARVTKDSVLDIAIDGPNDLAVGIERHADQFVIVGGDERGSGRVWFSSDGNEWSRTALDDVPPLSIAASNGTSLVSAAVSGAPELANGRTQVFQSVDGIEWSITADFRDAGATALLAVGDQFVMVGNLAGAEPHTITGAAWRSEDGRSWTPMETPQLDGVLSAATLWRGIPIAVGYTLAEGQQKGVIWAADGQAPWRPIVGAPVEASRLYSVATFQDQLVIVGSGSGLDDKPVVLIGKPD